MIQTYHINCLTTTSLSALGNDAISSNDSPSDTVFPRIIAGAIISIFTPKGGDYLREGDYSRGAIISNISHKSSCPMYFVLLYQAISEIHEHYHRKNCKKPGAFVTIQL